MASPTPHRQHLVQLSRGRESIYGPTFGYDGVTFQRPFTTRRTTGLVATLDKIKFGKTLVARMHEVEAIFVRELEGLIIETGFSPVTNKEPFFQRTKRRKVGVQYIATMGDASAVNRLVLSVHVKLYGQERNMCHKKVLKMMTAVAKCKNLTELNTFIRTHNVAPPDLDAADAAPPHNLALFPFLKQLVRNENFTAFAQVVVERNRTLSTQQWNTLIAAGFDMVKVVKDDKLGDEGCAALIRLMGNYFRIPHGNRHLATLLRLILQTGYTHSYGSLPVAVRTGYSSLKEIMDVVTENSLYHLFMGQTRVYTKEWLTFYLFKHPSSFAREFIDWALNPRSAERQGRYRVSNQLKIQRNRTYAPCLDMLNKMLTYWSFPSSEQAVVQKHLFESVLGRVGGDKPTMKQFREKWDTFDILSRTKKAVRNKFASKWINRLY